MARESILVVEDEAKIAEVLHLYLERNGYEVSVASDGHQALESVRRQTPDLVLLDLNLPGVDGLEVCRRLRQESSVPIIMVTARSEETDKLIGLELGADDYVTKPFSPREIVARVRAVLRRVTSSGPHPSILRVGELSLDPQRHVVQLAGRQLDLTPTEFRLLRVLMGNPGRVFSRLQLLEQVQGDAFEGYERTVDAHIKNLRQKIESNPQKPARLLTVYGVGYKLAERSDA